jgi:hypothetical protein
MTTSLLSHPTLPFVLAALLVPLGGPLFRRLISLLAPVAALAMLATLPLEVSAGFQALGHDWLLLRVDALSRIFAWRSSSTRCWPASTPGRRRRRARGRHPSCWPARASASSSPATCSRSSSSGNG